MSLNTILRLLIPFAAVIYCVQTEVTVSFGHDFELSCSDFTEVQWKIPNSDSFSTGDVLKETDERYQILNESKTFRVTGAQPKDSGLYICEDLSSKEEKKFQVDVDEFKCDYPQLPKNGALRTNPTPFTGLNGTTIEYYCNLNFYLDGPAERQCLVEANGWTGSHRECTAFEDLVSHSLTSSFKIIKSEFHRQHVFPLRDLFNVNLEDKVVFTITDEKIKNRLQQAEQVIKSDAGRQGNTGEKGQKGEKGTSRVGLTGNTGRHGIVGAKGNAGFNGIPGQLGRRGAPGVPGRPSSKCPLPCPPK